MIRHERVTSLLRVYDTDTTGGRDPPHVAIVTLIWEDDPQTVWLEEFFGSMTPRLMWRMHKWLFEQGVSTVKAHRVGKHALTGGVVGEDGVTTTDLKALFRSRRT